MSAVKANPPPTFDEIEGLIQQYDHVAKLRQLQANAV